MATLTPVPTGVLVTSHVCVAGEASIRPSASIARTWTSWAPTARSASGSGESQLENEEPSTAHSNSRSAEAVWLSVPLNVTSPVVLSESDGPERICVSGASVSGAGGRIVHS